MTKELKYFKGPIDIKNILYETAYCYFQYSDIFLTFNTVDRNTSESIAGNNVKSGSKFSMLCK